MVRRTFVSWSAVTATLPTMKDRTARSGSSLPCVQLISSFAIRVPPWGVLLFAKEEAGVATVALKASNQRIAGHSAPGRHAVAGGRVVGPHLKHLAACQRSDVLLDQWREVGTRCAWRIEHCLC